MNDSFVGHPGYMRALAAVSSGEIGLLRAVALDLVITADAKALDVLGPTAIDLIRNATGTASVELQAFGTPDGKAITFLGKTERMVAVSAHQSVAEGEADTWLRAVVRVVGTHGSVLVDLLSPALDVRTAHHRSNFSFVLPGKNQPVVASTAEALTAIERSLHSGHPESITW